MPLQARQAAEVRANEVKSVMASALRFCMAGVPRAFVVDAQLLRIERPQQLADPIDRGLSPVSRFSHWSMRSDAGRRIRP